MSYGYTSEVIIRMKEMISSLKNRTSEAERPLKEEYMEVYSRIVEALNRKKVLHAVYYLNEYLDRIGKELDERNQLLSKCEEDIREAIRQGMISKELIE